MNPSFLFAGEQTPATLWTTSRWARAWLEHPAPKTDPLVYELNGLYYQTSRAQRREHMQAIAKDVVHHVLTPTTPKPFVGPNDYHLNQHAVDDLMRELAQRLAPSVPDGPRRP